MSYGMGGDGMGDDGISDGISADGISTSDIIYGAPSCGAINARTWAAQPPARPSAL